MMSPYKYIITGTTPSSVGAHSESVKEVISWLLVLHEQLEVLEDLFLDGHLVVIADRVLTEEIKLHHELFTIHLLVKSYTNNTHYVCMYMRQYASYNSFMYYIVCKYVHAFVYTSICCALCSTTMTQYIGSLDGQKQGILRVYRRHQDTAYTSSMYICKYNCTCIPIMLNYNVYW